MCVSYSRTFPTAAFHRSPCRRKTQFRDSPSRNNKPLLAIENVEWDKASHNQSRSKSRHRRPTEWKSVYFRANTPNTPNCTPNKDVGGGGQDLTPPRSPIRSPKKQSPDSPISSQPPPPPVQAHSSSGNASSINMEDPGANNSLEIFLLIIFCLFLFRRLSELEPLSRSLSNTFFDAITALSNR